MVKAFLQALLKMLTQLLSLFLYPIDQLVQAFFPDLSNAINSVVSGLTGLFNNMIWPLSILPASFHSILIIIFTLEIAYLGLFIQTIIWPRLFRVIQKLKFW